MAKTILRDAFISIDGVDISDHCSQVSIEITNDEIDLTSFGANMKENDIGLGDGTITLSVFQDFEAASIDATIWPIFSAKTDCDVVVRPTSAALSATNPEYRMNGKIPSYSPISGSVGEASTTDVAIRNYSQAGVTRHTS